MQKPNIPLMKTPQSTRHKKVSASGTQPDYSWDSEISANFFFFFATFTQAAKSNTKTWKHLSARKSDSFCYNFWTFAVIPEKVLFRWLLLPYRNRLYYPWGRGLKQGARQTQGKHIRSFIQLFPLWSLCLHRCCSPKMQAVSAASSAFSLSTRPGFQ